MHRIPIDQFNALLQAKYEYLIDNLYQPAEIDADTFAKYCYSLALEQMNNIYILDGDEIPQIQI